MFGTLQREKQLCEESSMLEVRIRGKNNTFERKKGNIFITLEEQSKMQLLRKEQKRQKERLKKLEEFERDREARMRNDLE